MFNYLAFNAYHRHHFYTYRSSSNVAANLPMEGQEVVDEPAEPDVHGDVHTTPTTSQEVARNAQHETTASTSQLAQPSRSDGRKRKYGNGKEDSLDKMIKQLNNDIQREKDDEAYQYAMSIATKLRKFTPYQFALARKDIETGQRFTLGRGRCIVSVLSVYCQWVVSVLSVTNIKHHLAHA